MKIKPIRFFLALLLVTGFLNAPCFASDEEGFDVPGKLKASQVLPADLISNEIFTVREEVEWFDGLNLFTVETEYGSFEIWGEPMLRVRLREFIAWNELKETSSLEVGARSAGRETLRSIDALLMAFAHPITTIKGVPEGIGRLFRQTARDIDGIAKVISRQKGEESAGSLHRQGTEDTSRVAQAAEILVGVNSSYRFWAQKVGVNPYTTNTALEEELNRVAKMDAYTGKSTDILVPDLVKGKLKIFSTVSEKIYADDWHEVVRDNKLALEEMTVNDDLAHAFLHHDYINLSLSTLIVETLKHLEGVEDRSVVIDQAVLLETEAEAIWFAESLLMVEWFHNNESPVARMLPDTLVPVVLTRDNRVVVFSSADYSLWTKDAAMVSAEFTTRYDDYSDQREVWVADQTSPRFVEGLAKLGWKVRSGNRGTLLPEIPWGLQDDGE